jgi:sigma-E factor negative regulatory protein RseA
MDGEVEASSANLAIDRVIKDEAARSRWDTYHLISDAFRNEYLLSGDFAGKVSARLADEPTVLAPRPRRSPIAQIRAHALSAAASVAAVATVGWLAFGYNPMAPEPASQSMASLPQQMAGAPQPVAMAKPAAAAGDVRAYLFAHQEYSPATQIQGVAPYVRTVSEVPSDGSR